MRRSIGADTVLPIQDRPAGGVCSAPQFQLDRHIASKRECVVMTLTQINARQCDGHDRKAATGRKTRVFLWRAAAAVTGATLFGLIAAPLLPLPWLPSSLVLAFSFGVAFVGGTGYGIVRAVVFPAAASKVSASWTGASVSATASALAASAVLFLLGSDISFLVAAYAIALVAAYVLVKVGCIEAGCCRAATRASRFDLRHIEIAASLAAVTAAALLLGNGHAGFAALVAVAGHLGTRIASRAMRQRLPRMETGFDARAAELTLLAALLATAAFAAVG